MIKYKCHLCKYTPKIVGLSITETPYLMIS